jgi:hypothetical protein
LQERLWAFEKAVQNKYFIGTVQNVCPATTRAIAAQTHECQLFQKSMLLFLRLLLTVSKPEYGR